MIELGWLVGSSAMPLPTHPCARTSFIIFNSTKIINTIKNLPQILVSFLVIYPSFVFPHRLSHDFVLNTSSCNHDVLAVFLGISVAPPVLQLQRPHHSPLTPSSGSVDGTSIACDCGTGDHDGVDHSACAAHICRESSSGFGSTRKAHHS